MFNKYELLQERISSQPALGQQRLKNMLQFLREDHVGKADLEKILTYEYKGKTEEQTELYTILVGLVVDLYIKENGQESFLELYNELQKEEQGEPSEKVEQEELKESGSDLFVPQNTDRTPKPVSPRKKIALVSQKTTELAEQQPIVSVEPTLPKEKTKEVEEAPKLVEEEKIESVKPTPYVAPSVEPILEEVEMEADEEEDETEDERGEVEVANDVEENHFIDEEDGFDEEEELEERKKGGVLKYLAVGIPAVLVVGSLVFWQVTTNNKNTSRTEQQVAKILQEAPKENKKDSGLSSSEYDDNIKTLTQGIDSIKQNDKTGLSGYLVIDDKKYIVQKYDQASGSLTVFDTDGEKVIFDEDWVQKLIDRSKEGKTKLPDSSANGDKISVESKESESSTSTEGSN